MRGVRRAGLGAEGRAFGIRGLRPVALGAEKARFSLGAGNRNRTYDLRITNAPLYQLSYSGIGGAILGAGRWPVNFRSVQQHHAQFLGQGEDHVFGLAMQLAYRAATQGLQSGDHALHQHLGG